MITIIRPGHTIHAWASGIPVLLRDDAPPLLDQRLGHAVTLRPGTYNGPAVATADALERGAITDSREVIPGI